MAPKEDPSRRRAAIKDTQLKVHITQGLQQSYTPENWCRLFAVVQQYAGVMPGMRGE